MLFSTACRGLPTRTRRAVRSSVPIMATKKRWSDFSQGQRAAILVGTAIEVVLTTVALADSSPASACAGARSQALVGSGLRRSACRAYRVSGVWSSLVLTSGSGPEPHRGLSRLRLSRPANRVLVARLCGPSRGDRLRSCAACSFDISLEYGQHAGRHDPDNREVEPIENEAFEPSRPERLITAGNKTCARLAAHSTGSPIVLPCRPTAVAALDQGCGLPDRSTHAAPRIDSVQALQPDKRP